MKFSVPVAAVLLSSKMRPAWRDVSKKACGVRGRVRKNERCRVLDDVDVIMDKFLWDTCFYLSPVHVFLDFR